MKRPRGFLPFLASLLLAVLPLRTLAEEAPASDALEQGDSSEHTAAPETKERAELAAELLSKAQAYYDDLEYDRVPPVAEEILAMEGLDIGIRLEAYRLQAQSLAIVADPLDAEGPFRLLLRAQPDFDLPDDTPPRILSVFRKVQLEERTILEQVEALRRKRIIEQLSIIGAPPDQARGGRPIAFAFRLRDPMGAVEAVHVPYRREEQPAWSVLALERDDEGSWRGAISGEWTASEDGFMLNYYVMTRDGSGPLLTLGAENEPILIAVAPGIVEREAFRPVPRWAWRSGGMASGLLAALGGGLALSAAHAQKDYAEYANRGLTEPIDGALLTEKANRGRVLFASANTALISAGVSAILTLAITPLVERAAEP